VYSLTINPVVAPLTITGPATLPAGTVNQAYPGATVSATGGTGAYSWSATGLPANLSIAPATGVISGTPTTSAGSPFSVTVKVTDAALATATKGYSLTINPAIGGSGVLLAMGNGSAAPGQTVEVPVLLTTQSGSSPAACGAVVSFDKTKLTYVSARK